MATVFERYMEKSRELDSVRKWHGGKESPEEDSLLEELDELWWELSKEEIKKIEEGAI